MATADFVGFQKQLDRVGVLHTVQGHGHAFFKAHAHFFGLDLDFGLPERHAHDGVDDLHSALQAFQILGFVCRAQHVAVGAVGLLGAHLVAKTVGSHECRHFSAATEFVDEQLVQPWLVDFQARVGQQTVAVEALDVVALKGAAIAPDVDVVFLHRSHEHGAGDGTAQGRGVEVGDAAGADVERTALDGGNAFVRQLGAAVDQTGFFSAVFHRFAGNFIVVRLVGLAQVGGVGIGQGALLLHPQQGGRGVQAAREGDADFLPLGQILQNGAHGVPIGRGFRRSGRCSGRARSREFQIWSWPAR